MRLATLKRKGKLPITLNILWFDLWVGAIWDQNKRVLYLSIIPALVVVIPTEGLTRCPHCQRLTPDRGSHCQECYRSMYTEVSA